MAGRTALAWESNLTKIKHFDFVRKTLKWVYRRWPEKTFRYPEAELALSKALA